MKTTYSGRRKPRMSPGARLLKPQEREQWLRKLVSDEDLRSISKVVHPPNDDAALRLHVTTIVLSALEASAGPLSPKEQGDLIAAIRDAATGLYDALRALLGSDSSAVAAFGLAIVEPFSNFNFLPGHHVLDIGYLSLWGNVEYYLADRERIKEDPAFVCNAYYSVLSMTKNIRDAARQTVTHQFRPPHKHIGPRPDVAREIVAQGARSLFRFYQKRDPTFTTKPPLAGPTAYGGELFELAAILDGIYFRAAGLNMKEEPLIGSVLKRLNRKQPKVKGLRANR